MTATNLKSRKRFLKTSIIIAGIFIAILLALHFWFEHNARTVLKQYISEQSKGKIKLELSQLELSIFSKRLQIHELDLVSTDSVNEPITYHVTFNKLSLKVGSVWALLFKKKLYLDSLRIQDPVVQIMQWRKDTKRPVAKDELSIPQEMGKLYNSLLAALNEFGVRRVIIDNAKISLINKMKPGSEPVTVSNIFFDLARSTIKKGNKNIYIKNDQTIELRTSNQDIALPGGRHRLSFKSFNLHLFRERIELDSCTVTALATDSVKSSYKIFFKKLSLTGVDFNAMSRENVIKADSVYCEEPLFDFNLFRSDAVKKKTEIPDPDKIIRELTGNLNLAFVGVKNAGIHFNINGKTKRSFSNSNKDNFEMIGFRVNPDSSSPVSIKRFDMTLRDYHLYNEDSSTAFSFDSLHFLNSKIMLNNFGILSRSGKNKVRNEIDIKVPFFQLSQLDWYQLIFEQNMIAKEAVLNNPIINFKRLKSGATGKKINLFDALQNVDSLLALDNVSVINGQMNMQLGATTSFNIKDINFNIYSNKLLGSTNREGLRRAVDHLSFRNGVLRLKNITAQLQNVQSTGNNLLYSDKISVTSLGNKIAATINSVHLDNMQLDEDAETIDVDGLGWKSATVSLKALPRSGKNDKNNDNSVHLRNLSGNNTQLNISNGPTAISTFIHTLDATSLYKKGKDLLRVEGFVIAGNDLVVNSKEVKVNADSYRVTGSDASSLTGVRVQQIKGRDSLNIQSPQVDFLTDLNALFANDLYLSNVLATAPVIKMSKWDTATAAHDTTAKQSPIRIDNLTALEPDISISTHRNDSVSIVNIPWSDNSIVQATGIVISGGGMQLGSLKINTTAATFAKPTGEILGIEKGKIDVDLSSISFGKKDGKMSWNGSVNKLLVQNAKGLQMGKGKNNLRFQQASLGNLSLSSEYLPDFTELMKANLTAWLHIPHGQYVDSNKTLLWYNANYTNSSRTLSLDSFVYHPTSPVDSVMAKALYELDYMTVKTGAISICGLDVSQYEKDSSFIAQTIKIMNPILTVYRDKKPPSSPFPRKKDLPVDMIKNIALPVSVDSLQIVDGTITYGEKNETSRKEGTLLLSNVNGSLTNIKNSNLLDNDSLSLTLQASLMDSAHIDLTLKESYKDSLSGFLLTAKIKSADLSVLNPVVVPIVNVKIASGTLDSVSFRAVGRKDVALGEMDMHYHKLSIQLIKDGDPNQSTFLQKALSFVANTLLIKNNNTRRMGVMYFKHDSTQSFVNYIVKTTLSGLASSVGAKSNRKYLKQYNQELKDNRFPRVKL
ncbi:MAG: hypothetical protein JWQ96_2127 [Segetibacter sp.]|nr:hypothetical protein [Segetibacter sp.]